MDAEAGQVTDARVSIAMNQLRLATEVLGKDTLLADVDNRSLIKLRSELLRRVTLDKADGGISGHWAQGTLVTFRTFLRWAASATDHLEHLPKNIDDRSIRITVPLRAREPLAADQVRRLVKAASDRTRLYLLLALNCGMTQQDMADLRPSEVDWKRGTITRKRSKTQDHERVPTVKHPL